MNFYKDINNQVHALDSVQFQHLLPAGCVEITEAEATELTTPIISAEEIKAEKWAAIKLERARRQAGGVKVGDKWFHSDDASRLQLLPRLLLGADVLTVDWKTMDGSTVPMTQSLAQAIFQAITLADQAIFAKAEQHKAAMMSCSDPANYDATTGWPIIYGEE